MTPDPPTRGSRRGVGFTLFAFERAGEGLAAERFAGIWRIGVLRWGEGSSSRVATFDAASAGSGSTREKISRRNSGALLRSYHLCRGLAWNAHPSGAPRLKEGLL